MCSHIHRARPVLATLRQRRGERPKVEGIVARAVKTFTFAELEIELSKKGVGHTEVLSLDRVLETPQSRHPGKCSEFSFDEYDFRTPDFPFPAHIRQEGLEKSPPLLGADTSEILQSLGYSSQEIVLMATDGIALPADPDAKLWAKPKKAE